MKISGTSADEARFLGASGSEEIPVGRRSFHRRLIVAVDFLFLVTMVAFVTVSYLSEKSQQYRQTFRHLDETLGVVSSVLTRNVTPEGLARLESELAGKTAVAHRIFVVNSEGGITASSDQALLGQSFKRLFALTPYGSTSSNWALAEADRHRWLVSSTLSSTPDLGGAVGPSSVVLMRSRSGSDEFVARFLGLHGLHAIVTLLLFTLVLHWIGRRYLRWPIERLAAYLQKLETGDFRAEAPEVQRGDELGWLARRFTRMAVTLKETVQGLVRAEKYATASVVTFRIAREMKEPLESLKRNILFLESLAARDGEIQKIGNTLRADRQKVVDVIRRLNEIEPPEEHV